jgi:hypothetical protein
LARRTPIRGWEPPGPFFSIGELEQKTGIALRTLVFWADRLVLHATMASRIGRGTHRRFPFRELQIAALLRPLSGGGLPIGVLGSFASVFRQAIDAHVSGIPPVDAGPGAAEIGATIDRATGGNGKNWVVAGYTPPDLLFVGLLTADADEPAMLKLDTMLPEGFDRSETLILLIDLNRCLACVREA